MEISIYFNNKVITVIPYHSVVSFRLFCEQHGLHTNWDTVAKRIDLYPRCQTEANCSLLNSHQSTKS